MDKNHKMNIYIFDKRDRNYMSRTAKNLKFKMLWCPNQGHYWAQKLETDLNLAPLMPDENKTFGGSLFLHFRIWWRHVHTLYNSIATGQLKKP